MSMNRDFWEAIVLKWCVYPDEDLLEKIQKLAHERAQKDMAYKSAYSKNPLDDYFDDEEDDDEF